MQYSKEDTAALKRMYNEHYTYNEIARALRRTKGSVAQQVSKLGLKPRNLSLLHLIMHRGRDVLEISKDPDKIKTHYIKSRLSQRCAEKKIKQAISRNAIANFKEALKSGTDRDVAIVVAKAQGATLTDIAKVLKVSKQAVSQAIMRHKLNRC